MVWREIVNAVPKVNVVPAGVAESLGCHCRADRLRCCQGHFWQQKSWQVEHAIGRESLTAFVYQGGISLTVWTVDWVGVEIDQMVHRAPLSS
jgi:hypothetical protein